MEQSAQVVDVVVIVLVYGLLLSLRSARVRRAWVAGLSWAWERLQPAEGIDPLVLEAYAADRRARLRRDVDRVRRLVASDSWMSATRQVGNRLACRRLEADLRRSLEHDPVDESRWTPVPAAWSAPAAAPRSPAVEILDLGPRPLRTRLGV